MNRLITIALVLASTLAADTASAQERQFKVTVPFNFNVGNTILPAGTYIVGKARNSSDFLELKDPDKGVNVVTMGYSDEGGNPKRANVLMFHKYGEQYFLSRIRSDHSPMNFDFLPSRTEKKVRRQVQEAGRYTSDPVLVALR